MPLANTGSTGDVSTGSKWFDENGRMTHLPWWTSTDPEDPEPDEPEPVPPEDHGDRVGLWCLTDAQT